MNFKQIRKASFIFAGLLAAAALSLVPSLQAQNPGQPARALRLSYVDGKVQLTHGGQALADQAVINAPLFEGTQISTGDDGKAEIQFEDGSVARLSPNSALTLKTLNSGDADIVLDRGLGYFEIQGGGQSSQIHVDFADSQVTASGFTVLRVNMDNPPGALAVFSGNAHVERGVGGSLDLHGGQSADFNGADPSNPDVADAIQPDSWDAWNSDRDQALTAEASTQSPATGELAGANASNPAWSDLDASGNWYNVPDQGYVWSPNEAANPGFDPYGNGSWIATPGYGYTWASAYPWGYLPYQCGAWNFYDGFGWGWAPGFGGCSPWWGVGFYGGPRFGLMPIGYRPIHRPIWGRGPGPGHVIPVNRTSLIAGSSFAARSRNTPVVIAGHTVEALRPMPSHSVYERASISTGYRAAPEGGQVGPRPAYTPSRPGFAVSPANSFSRGSSVPTYTGPRASAPASHPNYAPRPSAPPPGHYSAPASHPSGGGGGGGHSGGGGHR